nr:ATP-dependent DNA helicase PIF1 [Tanacetum cinerariifolium]
MEIQLSGLLKLKENPTNADTNDGFSLCFGRGKVRPPVALKDPPPLLRGLMNGEHPKSKTFMENIRRYNSMFSFTSLGVNVDNLVNSRRGPFCFRIQGKNTHSISDSLPKPGDTPKFYQLYIYDQTNEIENHIGVISNYNVNLIVSVQRWRIIIFE